ncbi:NAD(P)-binding protein [Aspergillus costaricaensis CBS 115574]|uniref:NAD(P)-binding protein n=1 Tax=Aspergillus costaricaensis CBS 115574 TaxID=1448317 RepID=A0ACD1IF36_9EURO|nr:NAD(P)-binding protein [Aspergillus costaricaensis CBS 115574]RAK88389.1 NAD(P)-binding protein [Aspergillus costaricaensis CBS 115574]
MRSYMVSGCSRGIGFELVRQLADSKDDIVIFASARSCNNPKFQELLDQHPERIVYVPLDVTDQVSIKNAAKIITSKLDGRGLDVLINNAGVLTYGLVEEISTTLGSISQQSINRHVTAPSYKVTKAALNMLTVLYANELEKEGFTIFCVSPGWLKTDLGSDNADLPVEVGVKSILEILHEIGRDRNGQFLNIHVPGWENAPGMNQYDGKEVPW